MPQPSRYQSPIENGRVAAGIDLKIYEMHSYGVSNCTWWGSDRILAPPLYLLAFCQFFTCLLCSSTLPLNQEDLRYSAQSHMTLISRAPWLLPVLCRQGQASIRIGNVNSSEPYYHFLFWQWLQQVAVSGQEEEVILPHR